MTAADHANTVRDALTDRQQCMRQTTDALAAVDALEAQADERDAYAKQSEEQAVESGKWRQRAEAAYQALSSSQTALAEEHKRAEAAEAERDRLADALLDVLAKAMTRRTGIHADGTETWAVPLAGELAAIARDALARTEQP